MRRDAWPLIRNAEELHDTLLSVGALSEIDCDESWLAYFAELEANGRAFRREVDGGPMLWIATERWPVVTAALNLIDDQAPSALPENLRMVVSKNDACMSLVRGWLEVSGPTTAAEIGAKLGMPATNVLIALEQLELAGSAMRGHFTHKTGETEWCDRRLLARTHRLTLDGLRKQIAPVDAPAFMRFLLAHHGVVSESSRRGTGGVGHAIEMLEGFEAPLGAWEHDLFPARVAYEAESLDQLFARGQTIWARLAPPKMCDDSRGQVLTRVSPISIIRRTELGWLLPPNREVAVGIARWDAQAVYEALKQHGALFFNDIVAATGLLPSQVEDALRELAALGMATSDGFASARTMATKSKHSRRSRSGGASRRSRQNAYAQGGRWSAFPPFTQNPEPDTRSEKWAWLLLRRYGVMFRDLLERESLAPSWGELVRTYRRLEMRGEIRGGRFVGGVAGEQFALPEAVVQLRKARDAADSRSWAVISAADPLNLVGVITNEVRIAARRSNRVVYCDGQAIAALEANEIRWLTNATGEICLHAENLLRAPARRTAVQRD